MTTEHLAKITTEALATDLIEFKRIVLPQHIDEYAFQTVRYLLDYAIQRMSGESIRVWCAGDGGQADETRGIVDLIRQHGHCDAILQGVAYSSHTILFAACQRRYVYPNALLAVHRMTFTYGEPTMFTTSDFKLMYETGLAGDEFMAGVYASASDRNTAWWMDKAYNGGLTNRLDADELIDIGMARPIVELGAAEVVTSPNGNDA